MTPDSPIRNAFGTQRRLDKKIAPDFAVPTLTPQPRWRYNLATITTTTTAAVATTLLLTLPPSPQPAPTVSSTPFEEASRSISLHLFTSSATAWQSPTAFLLNTGTTRLLPPLILPTQPDL